MHFLFESLIEKDVVALSDIHVLYVRISHRPKQEVQVIWLSLHRVNSIRPTHPRHTPRRSRYIDLVASNFTRAQHDLSVNRDFSIFTVLRFTRTRKTPSLSAAHRCESTRYRSAIRAGNIGRSCDCRSIQPIRGKSSSSVRRKKSSQWYQFYNDASLRRKTEILRDAIVRHKSSEVIRERYVRSVHKRLRLVRHRTSFRNMLFGWSRIATQTDRSRLPFGDLYKKYFASHDLPGLDDRRRSLPQMSLWRC